MYWQVWKGIIPNKNELNWILEKNVLTKIYSTQAVRDVNYANAKDWRNVLFYSGHYFYYVLSNHTNLYVY